MRKLATYLIGDLLLIGVLWWTLPVPIRHKYFVQYKIG